MDDEAAVRSQNFELKRYVAIYKQKMEDNIESGRKINEILI